MLRPLMLDGVSGEIHSTDVVAVDERALDERSVELRQELSEPGRLRHAVRDSPVLRLSTGAGEMTGCRLDDQETRLPPRKTA